MKISSDDQLAQETPHNILSTPLGRFIERHGYIAIGCAALVVIFASASYFFLAAGTSNGLSNCAGKDFSESLYFSVITFTTVTLPRLDGDGWWLRWK
jgi:hypothetical protein